MSAEPSREPGVVRPLRADARRNQDQILAAARDVFVERGPDAPLEEVAKRAGVGIATVYRRFADRRTLMVAVVLRALEQTRRAAEDANLDEADAFVALTKYMHAALDLRVSAVIPVVLDRIDLDDPEVLPARDASARAIQQIIDEAHASGALSPEVTFGDIAILLIRLARPLPGPIPADLSHRLAHRHLDLTVEGLRPADGRRRVADGPALSHEDLRSLRGDANRRGEGVS